MCIRDRPGTHCHFVTWSPDGEFIYFVRGDPPSADWDIWRLRPSGVGLERLTFHDSRVTYPVLLDAGTLLYLATDVDGSGPWLYVMDLALKRTRRVSVGLERYTSLSANADRTRLVATVADFRSDLWRVSVDSGGPPATKAERIAPVTPSASGPRFGSGYIAYVSSGGARRGIWKYANGTATELWGDASVDRVGAPAISPDGRRIAFSVETVSYTHLDVYKRQLLICRMLLGLVEPALDVFETLRALRHDPIVHGAVSYTHLDVYKRQNQT